MAKDKTAVIAEGMFAGDKLYQVRARQALPLLVRQALAQAPVCYDALAKELGMPNARNLNFVLGSVGTTLQQLGQKKKWEIPPIQSLVLGKGSGLPGKGFFEGFTKLQSPTRQQRQAILNKYHAEIYAYTLWLNVLAELGLQKADPKASEAVEKARHMQGGGEGEAHRALKDRIYNQPSLVGGPAKPTLRDREYRLPSGDCVDVYFEHASKQLAVEVKPSTSGEDDIARGLFQCVKYETILTKWRAWQSTQVDVRVVLVLGGPFPVSLLSLRNSLGVEVMDQLNGK